MLSEPAQTRTGRTRVMAALRNRPPSARTRLPAVPPTYYPEFATESAESAGATHCHRSRKRFLAGAPDQPKAGTVLDTRLPCLGLVWTYTQDSTPERDRCNPSKRRGT